MQGTPVSSLSQVGLYCPNQSYHDHKPVKPDKANSEIN
jgi:hypothetical protein